MPIYDQNEFKKRFTQLTSNKPVQQQQQSPQQTKPVQQPKQEDFQGRFKQLVQTNQQQVAPKQPSIMDRIKSAATDVKDRISSLIDTTNKKTFVSPIPDNQLIKKPETNNILTPLVPAVNIIDSLRKDITSGMDQLSKGVVNQAYAPEQKNQFGKIPGSGNITDLTKRNQIDAKSLPGKINKDFGLGITGLIEGATGGILKSSGKNQPQTVDEKIIYGVTNVLGSVKTLAGITGQLESLAKGSATVGSFLDKYPKIAKIVVPWATNTLGFDLYGQLDPDTQNRLQKLASDTAAGTLFSAAGKLKKGVYSIPANFGIGYALAKASGASNQDAFISGGILSVLDASHRAKTQLLKSNFKDGSLTMTPDALRSQAQGTNFAGSPAADVLEKAAAAAEASGKDIQVNLAAAQRSKTAKFFNAKTPEGFTFSLQLIDRKEIKLVDNQGSPIPSTKQGVPDIVAQELSKNSQETPGTIPEETPQPTTPVPGEVKVQTPAAPEQVTPPIEQPVVPPQEQQGQQPTDQGKPPAAENQPALTKASDSFYIKQKTGDVAHYTKVDGRPIVIDKNIDTFIHKEDNAFVISTTKTGENIATGDTRAMAIESAQKVLADSGQAIQSAIQDSVTSGDITPRFTTSPKTKEITIPDTFRTPTEQASFKQIQEQGPQMIEKYLAVNKNELDPDKLRTLFNEYKGFNVNDFNRPVGVLKDKIYTDLLEQNQGQGNNTVLITAGGSGSGKTSALKTADIGQKSQYPVIFDTTLSYGSAPRDINKALDKGYKVEIVYTIRKPVDAWTHGVLPRVEEEGRIVSEGYFIKTHQQAKDNIIHEYTKYKDNDRVTIQFIDNTGSEPKIGSLADLEAISYNTENIAKDIAIATDKAYEERKITENQYKAIINDRSKSGSENAVGSAEGVHQPKETSQQPTEAKVIEKPKTVSFTSRAALASQSSFTDTLNEIRLASTSEQDLIKRTSNAVKLATRGANNTPGQIAGIRTALNKELYGIVGETGSYKHNYALLQTFKKESPIADYLTFLEDTITTLDTKLGRRTNGISFADREAFAQLENITQQIEENKISIIEFPEMVKLAEALMGGNRPIVTDSKRGNYRGLFKAENEGTILLKADIFKTPGQAAKTLAHEIGHLFDYLPDKTMARGNLIGKIATLNNFLRDNFSSPEIEQKIDMLIAKRKPLQKQRQDLRTKEGVVPEDKKPQDIVLRKQIVSINKEIRDLQKITIKNPLVKDELLALSAKWRPIAPDAKGTADEIRDSEYRSSAHELYADAISVLFNDPVRLKQEAPIFWDSFFKYIDRKPEAKSNLYELYDILNADPEKLFQQRDQAMEESFNKAEEQWTIKELEKRKRQSSILHQISTLWYESRLLVDDKNLPVNARVKMAKKQGIDIADDKNPAYQLEGLNYIDAKVKNYITESFQPVFEKAQKVANGWVTLGKVLQLERTIYERGELANPGGYDPKTAQDQLDALEKYSDAADWRVIQDAKILFRRAVQKSITTAEKAGYYSPDMITQMKANPAYAAYQVVDYLDTYVSAKVNKSVGTLKDIANPATSTIMKTISLVKSIERNKAKVDTIDFLTTAFSTEIEKARSVFNGKSQQFLEPKNSDQGLVIIIRDGKAEGYYIPKAITNTLNFATNDTIIMAAKISRIISVSPFYRPLFTSLSLGFQSFNFARDFQRYWKNTPDYTLFQAMTSLPRAAVRYGQAVPHAIKRVKNLPDKVIQEMENSKILGLQYNDYFKDPVDPGQKEIERVLTKIGILEGGKQKSALKRVLTPIYKTLDAVDNFGNFIEALPKVAGYIDLKDKMPQEELAHFVRNYIGSPNFRTRGEITPVTNNIFLFSNAIKEGIKSDFVIASGRAGRKSQASFWWKSIFTTILPTLMMAGMAAGMFGTWYKNRMDDVSEYDKSNYTILPFGVDEKGKTQYIRIPRDETSRFLGAIFWKALTIVDKKKAGIEDAMDLFSFGAGQFPNVSPSFVGIGAIISYMSGQNPYDEFRHRNVIPDKEFQAGTTYSLPIFTKWLLENQGLSVVIPSYVPSNPTELEKVLNLPVLSNILGRWVKVSDYGRTEQLQQSQEDTQKHAAVVGIEQTKQINDAIKAFQSSKDTSDTARKQAAFDTFSKIYDALPADQKSPQKRAALKSKVTIAFVKGESDPNMNALISAQTNDEKALILYQVSKKMSEKEFSDFQAEAMSNKVISRDVLKKYNQSKTP